METELAAANLTRAVMRDGVIEVTVRRSPTRSPAKARSKPGRDGAGDGLSWGELTIRWSEGMELTRGAAEPSVLRTPLTPFADDQAAQRSRIEASAPARSPAQHVLREPESGKNDFHVSVQYDSPSQLPGRAISSSSHRRTLEPFSVVNVSQAESAELLHRSNVIKQDVLDLDQLRRDIADLASPESSPRPLSGKDPLAYSGPSARSGGDFGFVSTPSMQPPPPPLESTGKDSTISFLDRLAPSGVVSYSQDDYDSIDFLNGTPAPPRPTFASAHPKFVDSPVLPSATRKSPEALPEFNTNFEEDYDDDYVNSQDEENDGGDFVQTPAFFAPLSSRAVPPPTLDGLVRDMDRFKYTPKMRLSLGKSLRRAAAPSSSTTPMEAQSAVGVMSSTFATRVDGAPPAPAASEVSSTPASREDDAEEMRLAVRAVSAPLTVLHELSSIRRRANAPPPTQPSPTQQPAPSSPDPAALVAMQREHDAEVTMLRDQLARVQQHQQQATMPNVANSFSPSTTTTSLRGTAKHIAPSSFEALLRRGALFVKLTSSGRAHEKFVFSDGTWLIWRNALGQSNERRLALRDVVRVVSGQATYTFRRRNRAELVNRCFSIVTKDRTLDLEVVPGALQPEIIRDEWIEAIKAAAVRAGANLSAS